MTKFVCIQNYNNLVSFKPIFLQRMRAPYFFKCRIRLVWNDGIGLEYDGRWKAVDCWLIEGQLLYYAQLHLITITSLTIYPLLLVATLPLTAKGYKSQLRQDVSSFIIFLTRPKNELALVLEGSIKDIKLMFMNLLESTMWNFCSFKFLINFPSAIFCDDNHHHYNNDHHVSPFSMHP